VIDYTVEMKQSIMWYAIHQLQLYAILRIDLHVLSVIKTEENQLLKNPLDKINALLKDPYIVLNEEL